MKPRGGTRTGWEKYHRRHLGTKPCGCPTCRTSRALREFQESLEERIEGEDERDMRLAHLLDEVSAVLAKWRWFPGSGRLRDAVRICR